MAKKIVLEIYPEAHAIYGLLDYTGEVEAASNLLNETIELIKNAPKTLYARRIDNYMAKKTLKGLARKITWLAKKRIRRGVSDLPQLIMENKALLKKFMKGDYTAHFMELGVGDNLESTNSLRAEYQPQYLHHLETGTPIVLVDDPATQEHLLTAVERVDRLEEKMSEGRSRPLSDAQREKLREEIEKMNEGITKNIGPRNEFMAERIVEHLAANKPQKDARYSFVTGRLHVDETLTPIQELLKKRLHERFGNEYEISVKVLPKVKRMSLVQPIDRMRMKRQLVKGTFFEKNPYFTREPGKRK